MDGATDFRAPNPNERVIWQRYREWCLRHERPDPGPVPEEWPTTPRQSAHALHVLADAILSGEEDPTRLAWELATRSEGDDAKLPAGCVAAPKHVCAAVAALPIRVGPRFVALSGTRGLGIYVSEGQLVYGLLPPGDGADQLLAQWPNLPPRSAAGEATNVATRDATGGATGKVVTRQVCLLFDRRRSSCWWVDRQAAMEFLWAQARPRG